MRPLSEIGQDIAHATAFLTRLPVPTRLFGNGAMDFGGMAWAFPLIAVPLTLIAGGIGWGAETVWTGSLIPALLVATALTVLTGALHEDGLADCADGFWGGHEPQRRLAIMRDSAIGTYGVSTLIAMFALRIAALTTILSQTDAISFFASLAAALAFARTAMLYHWIALPPAPRAEAGAKGRSLAARFGRPDGRQALIATVIAAALLVCAIIACGPLAPLLGLAAAILAAIATTAISQAKVGGHTGDTLGATCLSCETGFLLGVAMHTCAA